MRKLLATLVLLLPLLAVRCQPTNPPCYGFGTTFCDSLGTPAGTGNRSGDLNGAVWGVSRVTGNQNLPSPRNGWTTTALNPCSEGTTPPHDIQVCNGVMQESSNDGGSVTTLAMYVKQPFDFANRTGAVVFDVSNDTQGNHAAWPEFWMSDQPVPAPFAHEGTFLSLPRNGFGIRFAGCSTACPRGTGTVGVDSAIVVNNYVPNDSFFGGTLRVTTLDSVTKAGPGQFNHYEVDIAQNQIDVYGTDAVAPGTSPPPTFRHIASIANAGLTLTRGVIWLEDAHYNAGKFGTQGDHTFSWANVGFDGPMLPQDRTFDVLDNTGSGLGYAGGSVLSTLPVDQSSLSTATSALLTFGYYDQQSSAFNLTYSVNGHAYPAVASPVVKWGSPKTLAVPMNLSDVVVGVNTVSISGPAMSVFNVDIILVGGGG